MSRYKRKYLSKSIEQKKINDIFRFERTSTINFLKQDNSDIVGYKNLTEWGIEKNARSIYDFNPVNPTADVQGNESNFNLGPQASISQVNIQGLLGELKIEQSFSKSGFAKINNISFGRNENRTLLVIAKIPVSGFAQDYMGGPGVGKDSFVQAKYNGSAGFNRATITPYTPVLDDSQIRPWITSDDSGVLSATLIRWDQSEGNYSLTYKVKGKSISSNNFNYSSGTNNEGQFYLGAINGASTSTINTKFYWIGFFDEYLNLDDFNIVTTILGI